MDIAILHQYPDFRRTVFYNLLRQESRTPLREVAADKAAIVIYGPFARTPKIVGRFVKRKASFEPKHFRGRVSQPISVFHSIENVRHENKFDFSISYDFSTTDFDLMGSTFQGIVTGLADELPGNYQQFGYSTNLNGVFVRGFEGNDFTISTGLSPETSIYGVRSLAVDSNDYNIELQSFFGRVNYSIADKY